MPDRPYDQTRLSKPDGLMTTNAGPSFDAWGYENAAVHRKLDAIMDALSLPPDDADEGRINSAAVLQKIEDFRMGR